MTVALEENNDMHESIDNYDSDDLIEVPSRDECDACYFLLAMMPIFVEMNLL